MSFHCTNPLVLVGMYLWYIWYIWYIWHISRVSLPWCWTLMCCLIESSGQSTLNLWLILSPRQWCFKIFFRRFFFMRSAHDRAIRLADRLPNGLRVASARLGCWGGALRFVYLPQCIFVLPFLVSTRRGGSGRSTGGGWGHAFSCLLIARPANQNLNLTAPRKWVLLRL